jgi:stress response protein YsnF
VLISPIPIGEMVNDLTSDQIENSPEYDPALPVNREYEVRSYDFYVRPCCGSR